MLIFCGIKKRGRQKIFLTGRLDLWVYIINNERKGGERVKKNRDGR